MIKDWFQRKPLRIKILLIFLPLAIFPLVIIGIITGIIFRQAMINEAVKNINYKQALIETRLLTMMEQVERAMTLDAALKG